MLNATDTEDKMIGPEMDRRRLAMVVVRSPFAHAHIRSIDVDAARQAEGVIAVYTAADLTALEIKVVCECQMLHAGAAMRRQLFTLAAGHVRRAAEAVLPIDKVLWQQAIRADS